jgi:hypothetical protein
MRRADARKEEQRRQRAPGQCNRVCSAVTKGLNSYMEKKVYLHAMHQAAKAVNRSFRA